MADDDATTGRPAKRAARAAAPAKKAVPVKKAAIRKVIPAPPAPPQRSTGSRKGPAGAGAAIELPSAAPAKKAAARKAVTRRTGAAAGSDAEAPATRAPRRSGSRLAAEQTFDDDWDKPAPPRPPASDPAARARALLRSAAADLQARETPPGRLTGYEARPDEPVTEVFVAPTQRTVGRRVVPEPAAEPGPAEPDAEPEEAAEWTIEEQVVDEDPPVDRIPDALDVLSVPGAAPSTRPSPLRRSTASPPPPPPPPPPPGPERAAAEPDDADPLPWTPPPSPMSPERSGGAGLSVLAIVLSLVVPVVGAVIGFVLATRARGRDLALAGVARVVAVVALVAWLVVGAVAVVAARDQGIDYSKLEVGDCFDSSATNEVRGIDVKACSDEHNSEVFFLVTHPAGPADPYPGKDALVQFAADACLGQPLTDYLGIPLEQSTLKDFEIVPQESAWEDGRRLLVCGIDTGGEGRITGSVKGTSR